MVFSQSDVVLSMWFCCYGAKSDHNEGQKAPTMKSDPQTFTLQVGGALWVTS